MELVTAILQHASQQEKQGAARVCSSWKAAALAATSEIVLDDCSSDRLGDLVDWLSAHEPSLSHLTSVDVDFGRHELQVVYVPCRHLRELKLYSNARHDVVLRTAALQSFAGSLTALVLKGKDERLASSDRHFKSPRHAVTGPCCVKSCHVGVKRARQSACNATQRHRPVVHVHNFFEKISKRIRTVLCVYLAGFDLSKHAANSLGRLSALQELELRWCRGVDAAALVGLPALQSLHLPHVEFRSVAALPSVLAQQQQLSSLQLDIDDDDVADDPGVEGADDWKCQLAAQFTASTSLQQLHLMEVSLRSSAEAAYGL